MNITGSGGGLPAHMLYTASTAQWDRRVQDYEEKPAVQRSVDQFLDRINQVETPEELLDDYELRTFILQAYNIDEELHNATGLLKKVLLEDLEAEDALAYQMTDQRFLKMATDLRLDQGLDVVKSVEGQTTLINSYYTIGVEMDLGDQNASVREALYFRRTAGDVESVYQILSDNALRTVVFGAYNIPPEIAYQDVDKQAAAIERHIDVDRLSDADYREELVDRYLLNQDRTQGGGAASGVLTLLQPVQGYGGLPTYQIGLDMLA